jgi:hypothetical protein
MQKAKQVAVQQQQQQKGLQALMGQAAPAQAPDRPPQPERQGSIDELESNLGENYAGGGIVAFDGTDGSDVKDESLIDRYGDAPKLAAEIGVPVWAYKRAQDFLGRTGMGVTVGEVAKALAKEGIKATGKGIANIAKTAATAPAAAIMTGGLPATQFTADVMKNNPKLREAYTGNYMLGAMDPDNALGAAILNESAKNQPSAEDAAAAKAETEKLRRLAAAGKQTKENTNVTLMPGVETKPAPAAGGNKKPGIDTLVKQPAKPAAPAAPAEMSDYEKILSDAMKLDPAKQRADALARRKAELGDIDTSAQDAYIKSLQGRLGGLEEPTDMYDRARAHLRRLATAGGRNWMETGAGASAAMQKERETAEQQKMALLKEIMGESTKVADLKRGEKEKAFSFAEKEYDETYKRVYDAAKEQGLNDREAKKMAHQSAENVLNRASSERIASIRSDAASGAGGDKAVQQAEAAFARDPEAQAIKKMLESPIYSMNPAKAEPLLTKLRAIQASKYAQFDRTIAEAPGAAAPSPGGTRPPLSSFQR